MLAGNPLPPFGVSAKLPTMSSSKNLSRRRSSRIHCSGTWRVLVFSSFQDFESRADIVLDDPIKKEANIAEISEQRFIVVDHFFGRSRIREKARRAEEFHILLAFHPEPEGLALARKVPAVRQRDEGYNGRSAEGAGLSAEYIQRFCEFYCFGVAPSARPLIFFLIPALPGPIH